MNENLKKAMKLFDTPDKWAAFCVLCDNRDEMLKVWLSELADKLQEKVDPAKWVVAFEHPGNTSIKIYLKEYGDRALSIVWYMDNPRVALWLDPKKYNADLAKSRLKDKLQLDDSYITGNDWDLYSKEIKELQGNTYYVLYALSHDDEIWQRIFDEYISKFVTGHISIFEDVINENNDYGKD